MKFINLRRPGSKPVFVVLPSENKKYTFYINNVKVVNDMAHIRKDKITQTQTFRLTWRKAPLQFHPVNQRLFNILGKDSRLKNTFFDEVKIVKWVEIVKEMRRSDGS